MLATETRPLLVLPGQGKPVSKAMSFLALPEHTNGAYALGESTLEPYSSGPPMHVHTREDEAFFVLAGTLRVYVGDEVYDAPAGSFVFLPREVPHTFCNPHPGYARVLGIISPGDFAQWFYDVAELAASAPDGTPDMAQAHALVVNKYGGRHVGPPPAGRPE